MTEPAWKPAARVARDALFGTRASQRFLDRVNLIGLMPRRARASIHPLGEHDAVFADGVHIRYVASRTDLLAKRVIWDRPLACDSEAFPVLRSLLEHGGTFVDVGAYSALWSLYACASNPTVRAVAIEPNPISVANALRNVRANGLESRVTVAAVAAGAATGVAVLRVPPDNSRASLLAESGPEITVSVFRLDDFLSGLTDIAAMKIDVEGSEPDVLAGAQATLVRCGLPPVIVEVLDAEAFAAITAVAVGIGYRHWYHLTPAGPVGVARFAGRINYLLTPTPVINPSRSAASAAV